MAKAGKSDLIVSIVRVLMTGVIVSFYVIMTIEVFVFVKPLLFPLSLAQGTTQPNSVDIIIGYPKVKGAVTVILALAIANTVSLVVLILHHGISAATRASRAVAVKNWRATLDSAIGSNKEINQRRRKAREQEIIGEILRAKLAVITPQERAYMVKFFEQAGLTDFYKRRLKSRLWWRRGDAVVALIEAHQVHLLDDIAKLLDDRFLNVRLAAAAGLAAFGGEQSISILVDHLDHLGNIGVHWLQDIFEIFLRDRPEMAKRLLAKKMPVPVEKAVIETVGDMRISRMVSPLVRIVRNKERDLELRISAVRALGKLGRLDRIACVALTSPDWEVRAAAAYALGESKAIKHIAKLEEALTDKSWWVRNNSAKALAKIGGRGRVALQRALESSDTFARDIARQTLDERTVSDEEEVVNV